MRSLKRPYIWLLPLVFMVGACSQASSSGSGSTDGTSTAAGSVQSSPSADTGCKAAVDQYVSSQMVVEFDRAIKACPDLATFASQIKGRDTTNTGVGLNMSCTSDVAPPAPGADLPTPDEAVLTSQVCSDYRTECVDLKTMADLTEAGNEGKYSYQVPGLDARADANTAKMKACESKYFGYSG